LLIWTNRAKCDLLDLELYLIDHNPRVGLELALTISRKAEILEDQPLIGRKGFLEGTREWPIPGLPYTLVYQIAGKDINILHVVHQARDWY